MKQPGGVNKFFINANDWRKSDFSLRRQGGWILATSHGNNKTEWEKCLMRDGTTASVCMHRRKIAKKIFKNCKIQVLWCCWTWWDKQSAPLVIAAHIAWTECSRSTLDGVICLTGKRCNVPRSACLWLFCECIAVDGCWNVSFHAFSTTDSASSWRPKRKSTFSFSHLLVCKTTISLLISSHLFTHTCTSFDFFFLTWPLVSLRYKKSLTDVKLYNFMQQIGFTSRSSGDNEWSICFSTYNLGHEGRYMRWREVKRFKFHPSHCCHVCVECVKCFILCDSVSN